MLTYLINVTSDLFAVALIIGVMFAFTSLHCGEKGQAVVRAGLILGLIISAVRSYITNTRRLVGGWKVGAYGYGVSLFLFILLILAFVILGKKFFAGSEDSRKATVPEIVIAVLIGLLMASYLYGAMPNIYVYPFKFDTGGNGILSTDFLFRLGGYLLGLLICLVGGFSANRITVLAGKKGYGRLVAGSFFLVSAMYAVFNFARLMLVLTPRKIVDSVTLFQFAAFSNNHAEWYTYGTFLILIIFSVILWVRSYTAKEPYANKAEHRKQRAMWRSAKRYSVVMALCFVCAILCATWFVDLNTVEIREAPVEDPQIIKGDKGEDSELRVPLTMVEDGHLHRFGYTTGEGNPVRFIVVLKQENTNNYGIGLDACDICGEAGYYENNEGQVVCKKCNVVMNKTTIGMKGGCNPIIIDYDINESYITVPVAEMVKNQDRFSK